MARPSLREKLASSAVDTLHTLGFKGCSIQDITDAAGVPAGLLRLDSPTPSLNAQANLVDEVQQPKVRTHVRKHHVAQ